MKPEKIGQKPVVQKPQEQEVEEKGFGKWIPDWVAKFFGVEAEKATEDYVEGEIVSKAKPGLLDREVKEVEEWNTLGLAVPEDPFSEDFVDGYNERVYGNQAKNWDIIFTKLETVFKDFDQNRNLYEGDPMRFMSDIGSNPYAVEVLNGLTHDDKEFGDAWEAIREEQINYYQDLVDQYYSDDEDYTQCVKLYNELNEVRNEAIDQRDGKKGDWDLWNEFEQYDEKKFNELNQFLYERNTAFFNGLAVRYYEKDREFQHALKVVSFEKERLQLEEPESVTEALNQEYQTNENFRKAINCINEREARLRTLFNFEYSKKDIDEKVAIVAPRLDSATIGREVRRVKDFVTEHPGVILTPAMGVAAFVMGSPMVVPATVGGVLVYHLANKAVIQPTLSYMSNVGVDIEKAKEDREVRMPYLERIFSLQVSEKEKLAFMKNLYANGLLFKDDLVDIDDQLKANFFKDIGAEEDSLLSLEEVKQRRQPLLRILHDDHASSDLKLDALRKLYEGGVLYKGDLFRVDYDNIKEDFLKELHDQFGVTEEDLIDVEVQKNWRNASLFLIKGKDSDEDYKLQQMKELHDKGLLFKQDIEQLKQAKGGKKLIEKFFNFKEMEGIELPDLVVHYVSEKRSLRKVDDQKRLQYLKQLESKKEDEQLEGLRGLHKMGLCFKQDLAKVPKEVQMDFAKEEGMDLKRLLNVLPDRFVYYKKGLGERLWQDISPERALGVAAAAGGVALGMIPGGGVIGAGLMAIGLAKGFPGLVRDPANVAGYGPFAPMKGILEHGGVAVKGVIEITAEAMDKTFGSFLYKTTALQDRVVKVMPTNAQIKQKASFVTNKTIAAAKWGFMGSLLGGWLGGLFGIKVGVATASFYGFCQADGRVKQMPAGGFIRAIKFGGFGAIVGAAVPGVLMAVVGGLALAGVIASASAITVATAGAWLIIPCIIFGVWAGYQIAGLTGKDEAVDAEDPFVKELEYDVPAFEVAKALLLE